jgi:hypothetical protein
MTDEGTTEGLNVALPEVTITGTVEEGQAYADGQAAAVPGGSDKMSAVDRAHPDAYKQGYMDTALEQAESELDEEGGRRAHTELMESIRGELFKDPPDP